MGSEFINTEYGLISKHLSHSTLGELCINKEGVQTGPFGSQLHNRDYVTYGTPIITVEHLGDNRILHHDLPCVSNADKKRLSRYLLQKDDIVFSRVGSVDRRALVRESENGWLYSGRCLRIRPKHDLIDSGYLSWFFAFSGFKDYIRRIAVGATMPSLNTKILQSVPIYFPSLINQRAIAHILGSLDDKIELNRQMNETLEAMARAIFKSWFVDFDPVRAKAEGLDIGLPKEIADLFPASFEDSELGEIPKGWVIKQIGDEVEFAYGKALKASDRNPGEFTVYGSNGPVGMHNKAFVKGPGIIIGRKGNPGIITWSSKDFYPIDTTFYIKMIGSTSSLYYIFYALKAQNLERLSADSAVPGLNRNIAYRNPFLIPPNKILSAYNHQVIPLFNKIDANNDEIEIHASQRDALLPKLISGELRIPDAEKLIKEAGL